MYSSDMYIASELADATMSSAPMMGLFLGILIFSLVLGLIFIISYWKIFNKAGKAGIASIIPIYNIIVMIQIAKLSLVYLILLLIPVVNIFAVFKINIEIAKKFGNKTGFGVGMTLLPIIFAPLLAFSDNIYKDDKVESKEKNKHKKDLLNNIAVNVNITNENAVNFIENNQKTLEQDMTSNNLVNEESLASNSTVIPNQHENIQQQNTNEPVVNMVPPVLDNTIPISNDIPVVEEVKVEPTPMLNAFNSTPTDTQTLNESTPSIDVKINNEISAEQSVEPIKPIEEITPQPITEIPVINEETITTEQKKVCKNCGEVLPSIVSICPKCGTDNE